MDPAAQMAVDFTSPELAEEGKESYSVLRAPFDQWLASKAEDAGAEYICGIAVEELLKDGAGRVTGVRAGEDEITTEVTILAEGCNTVLAEKCLGNPRRSPPRWPSASSRCSSCRPPRSRTASRRPRARRARRCCSWATARTATSAAASSTRTRIRSAWGSWRPSRRRPTARTRTRCTRCSRTSRATRPWLPSSAVRSWWSTPATWCRRAATTWCLATCSTAASWPERRRACA